MILRARTVRSAPPLPNLHCAGDCGNTCRFERERQVYRCAAVLENDTEMNRSWANG
jgi:hypothetical protein